MNANFKEINPEPANRLKQLMEENMNDKGRPLKASDLHRMTGISQKHLSNILTLNKPLTEGTARKIISVFPGYSVPWLLGYDGPMSEMEEWRELSRELREGAMNQETILAAVGVLMKFYGIDYDGKTSPVAKYKGVRFHNWELDKIAMRVFDSIGTELDFMAEMKKAYNLEEC